MFPQAYQLGLFHTFLTYYHTVNEGAIFLCKSRNLPTIIRLIIERTCIKSVYAQDNYTLDSRQRFYRNLIMQCVFNSCSFNYKSDYSYLSGFTNHVIGINCYDAYEHYVDANTVIIQEATL